MTSTDIIRPDWPAPENIVAMMTTRRLPGASLPPHDRFNLGMRCGDQPQAVAENRRHLRQLADLPSAPQWLSQVHGTTVCRVSASTPLAEEPTADAAVTGVPGAVLAVLTADCLPVLLCSLDGKEVAAAHAGWRGLAAGILEASVAAMQSPPEKLIAWLGVAAGPQRYEIGSEVRDAFVSVDAQAAACFVATRPGHWLMDIYALARRRLQSAGLSAVHGGGLCTISDAQRFYSYRRDGRTGRMATLIHIAPGH